MTSSIELRMNRLYSATCKSASTMHGRIKCATRSPKSKVSELEMPADGADNIVLAGGEVIRWEFSLSMGPDIGFDQDWPGGAEAFIARADRTELAAATAAARGNTDQAMAVLGSLLATQDDIDAAVEALAAAAPWWACLPAWLQWILRWLLFGWIWK